MLTPIGNREKIAELYRSIRVDGLARRHNREPAMTLDGNTALTEAIVKTVASRVHGYFPELSTNLSISVPDRSRHLVRTHSTLFEISVLDRSTQATRGMFVKIPKLPSGEALKSLYQHLTRVYEFSTRLSKELNVVRPLDYLPEFGAIVTERVDGQELKDLLRSGQRRAEHSGILKNCGRLFRAYHDELGYVSRQGDFRELYLHEFRDSIRQLEAYKVRKDSTRRILAEAEKAAGRLKDGVPICSTEKDYRPGNIIIQDTRIFLIEVDYPVLRPVYEDFAKFLNDLTTLFLGTPWFLLGYQAPRRLQKSFLTGYFGDGAPIDFISLFCAKNLCFRWYRALEALFAGRYRNQFFMPKALYERQIHRVFYREIMAQLRIARRWPEKAAPGTLSGAPELPPIRDAGLR